jgi:hypothetical protein
MRVALETVKAMSLNLSFNSKVWGKGLDPKRVVVAEDGVSAASTLTNNIQKCVEIMLEASNTDDVELNA